MDTLIKYPRTRHLKGSRLQKGDEDLSQIPFSEIFGRHIVIEEKIDGANTAISFDPSGRLLLQNRGHYLDGGGKERHYNLLKMWANTHRDIFFRVLGSRYIMYGEWMYAKHTVFYDALPDYFMEFDIYDRERGVFLDTASRRSFTERMEVVHSVPVIGEGVYKKKEPILALLAHSNYITDSHIETLRRLAEKQGLDADAVCSETDTSTDMEGLYIKVEENGTVVERMKYVRPSFVQAIGETQTHWVDRPIIPNQLARQNY
ncbi:MAG: RNA ligase family protein [Clostridia bacterium]|nr:RNA ligase family protein [Clostridia bacterium]